MCSTYILVIEDFYQKRYNFWIWFCRDPLIDAHWTLFLLATREKKHKVSEIGSFALDILFSQLVAIEVPEFLMPAHQAIIIYLNQAMSSYISYEILINLKQIDVINIRQSSFFQIRVTIFQSSTKENTSYGVPFLMFKSEPENKSKPIRNSLDPSNTSEIDASNNSFLTRKFIIRSVDEEVNINEMCLFKGTLAVDEEGYFNRQIKIYVQLISYQQSEAEIVTDWQGHTFRSVGSSFLPIYFNSYKCTCNLNASIHAITTSLSLQAILSDGKLVSSEVQRIGNISFLNKFSEQLQISIEQLKKALRLLKVKLESLLQSKEVLIDPATYRYCLFKKYKSPRNLQQSQLAKIESQINQMPISTFLSSFKEYIYLLNQISYQLWKKLQLSLINEYSQAYEEQTKALYKRALFEHHKRTDFLLEENGKPIIQNRISELFVYAFEKHQTFFKTTRLTYQMIFARKPSIRRQLIVFVHGYQASSFDMEPLSNYLRYKYPSVVSLLSTVNQGKTEQEIEESAHRLAIEVKNFINSSPNLKEFEINFVCHSLGGIIARASLKYLQSHKNKFNHFVSICSPHLGYLYHSSTLISTSLWILNKVRKDPSMIQLTMSDSSQLDKTYLYGLSLSKELNWFKHIWLFGSKEDQYVPYWSAILETKNFMFETESAKIYRQLLDNITKDIQQKIIRCQIVYNQKSKDLSNLIGRTGHIKLLNYVPGIQLLSALFVP